MASSEVTFAGAGHRDAVQRARRVLRTRPLPLDGIARLAARLLGTPMAAVTLVDARGDYFAGAHGVPAALIGDGNVPLQYSLCKYVVATDHPVSIEDLAADARHRSHPLVTEFGIRSFLGVPLRDAEDCTVGALSVAGTDAREWSGSDLAALVDVAGVVDPIPVDERQVASAAVAGLDASVIVDQLLEAFVAIGSDGVIVGWNRAAEKLFGWSVAEITGRHVDRLAVPEEAGELTAARLRDVLTGAAPEVQRVRGRHRDGRRLLLRARLSAARGPAGAVVCAFLVDETARVEAEDAAAAARHLTETLVDNLDAGVITADSAGRLLLANRAVRALFHLPEDWTPDGPCTAASAVFPWLRRVDGSPLRPDVDPLRSALRGGSVRHRTLRTIVPDQPVREVRTSAHPVPLDGDRRGAVVIFEDVTEARRTDRANACELRVARLLADAESLSAAAPEVARAVAQTRDWDHVVLWLADAPAGTLAPAGLWTRPTFGIADLTPEQVRAGPEGGTIGTTWETGVIRWIADLADPAHDAAAAADPWLRDARERGVRAVVAVPIPGENRPTGVLSCASPTPQPDSDASRALLTGVVTQIASFQNRRDAQTLTAELLRVKNDYLTLVGHELRTPLTAMVTYTELLATSATSWPNTDRLLLDVIVRNTKILRSVVDELLDLAAMETGHLVLSPIITDLARIVADAVATATAVEDTVPIRTDLPENLTLTGDPDRLRQIVDSLLAEALRHSPPGVAVTVALHGTPDVAVLRVTDQGSSTPTAERARLFDHRYRAGTAHLRSTTGVGLGLGRVRALVEAHAGTLVLAPLPAGGTVTTVQLPRRPGAGLTRR